VGSILSTSPSKRVAAPRRGRAVKSRPAPGPTRAAASTRTHPLLEIRSLRALIWLAIILALIWICEGSAFILVHVFNVLLLFIFAGIIALILTPLVDRMERVPPFRGHRSLAVLLIYAVGIVILAGAILLLMPTLTAQVKGLPSLLTTVEDQLRRHGISFSVSSLIKAVNGQQLGVALGVATAFVSGLVSLVLILVISIYLLIEGRAVVATARNVFPSRQREFDFAALAVGSTVAAYVRGQVVMSFVIGTYTGVALTLVGVKYAILIGIAAFFLEFVPIVGAVVAMALAVAVALVQSPTLALFAAGVGVVGHAIDAYLLGPRVYGRVTRLHALVAMAALLVGAELGGILGALFAVPVAAVANIFLGALYRARRGEKAMSTAPDESVSVETLPRLGEEVSSVEEEGLSTEPVPHGV
jgi:predicted PurR-regulated permease PerM